MIFRGINLWQDICSLVIKVEAVLKPFHSLNITRPFFAPRITYLYSTTILTNCHSISSSPVHTQPRWACIIDDINKSNRASRFTSLNPSPSLPQKEKLKKKKIEKIRLGVIYTNKQTSPFYLSISRVTIGYTCHLWTSTRRARERTSRTL